MALFKVQDGLKKTREGVFSKINRLITGKRKIDEDLLEELEEIFISGDVGVSTALNVIDNIRERVRKERYESSEELDALIKDEVAALLEVPPGDISSHQPAVIMVVGVNGTGKTTSIAKLGHYYKQKGKSVLLAAADTFRAAAIDQLQIWGERIGCDVIKHQPNADPAAVAYDAIIAAKARKVDYLIIDTAGRLDTFIDRHRLPEPPQQRRAMRIDVVGQAMAELAANSAYAVLLAATFHRIDGDGKGGRERDHRLQRRAPLQIHPRFEPGFHGFSFDDGTLRQVLPDNG